ncbi:hypothetical protein MLD38_005640 [Melastoma candidum]|uniref:Uncharacterized protein n=1 Tax=Melastoma candidum TaxID=119954 RepID=A0ACB9RKV3_9MYRT|nr:hypothetical protein MLD38_005640 [Melastoma candidum]
MEAPEYHYHGQADMVASAPGEHFVVDDLLDFSNEDAAPSVGDQGGFLDSVATNSADSSSVNTPVAVESCNSSACCDNAGSNYCPANGGGAGFYGTCNNLAGELCVPYDDVAELEWLSNFVEDSFSAKQPSLSLHFLLRLALRSRRPPTPPRPTPRPATVPCCLSLRPWYSSLRAPRYRQNPVRSAPVPSLATGPPVSSTKLTPRPGPRPRNRMPRGRTFPQGGAFTVQRRRPHSGGPAPWGQRHCATHAGFDTSRAGLCPSTDLLRARPSCLQGTPTPTGRCWSSEGRKTCKGCIPTHTRLQSRTTTHSSSAQARPSVVGMASA